MRSRIFRRRNSKRASASPVKLKVDGAEISVLNSTKFLGLTLDSKLNWNEHINYLCKKSKRILIADAVQKSGRPYLGIQASYDALDLQCHGQTRYSRTGQPLHLDKRHEKQTQSDSSKRGSAASKRGYHRSSTDNPRNSSGRDNRFTPATSTLINIMAIGGGSQGSPATSGSRPLAPPSGGQIRHEDHQPYQH